MPLKADYKYNGIVRSGSCLVYSQTDTVGYQVMLDCEDGPTYFIIWMTEKNRKNVMRGFEALEIPMTKLSDPLFFDDELSRIIEGKEVRFGTREETYKGKTSVKVAWIGKKSEGSLPKDAAAFFNKPSIPEVSNSNPEQNVSNPENDIPF